MKFVPFVLAASLAATSLIACTDESDVDEDELSTNTQSVVSANHMTANRIATNRIATNRIATNRIATNRIATNRFQLDADSAGELLTTAEGRELLTYVLSCALASGQSVEADYGGTHYVFNGDIGLGKNWVYRSLTGSEQRWVSACLLSRVNAHDISLLISLRGPNVELATSDAEAAAYTVQEGSFYGNIFVDPSEPLLMYACRGFDQAMGEPASGNPLGDRDCTEEVGNSGKTQCDFKAVGDCAVFTDEGATFPENHGHCNGHHYGWGHGHGHGQMPQADLAPYACEEESDGVGGYFRKCHSEASDEDGQFENHTRYREVITVYLQP